ncbi:MAG: DUF975 family protein, partial [Clostridiales bacterium]|nr:DUF975 family protein [Clostridiales bacterium]
MGIKDIKAEARAKLALNMHQAIVIYTIEYAVLMMMLVMIVLACISIGSLHLAASIVFISYGCILMLVGFVCCGILSHAMVDYYLASYKCKPYNIRRLGDTLARNGLMKVFMLNVKRVALGFLLCLCLIVPGIIYLMRTSMASNLLIANPMMKASTALSASSKVMGGKTGSYFSLMMSLLGWWLLGILTFGLGLIFVMPYINMCKTVYYKRNLQGDKTVYKTVVQPVSPMPMQQQPMAQMPNMQQMQQQMMQQQHPMQQPVTAQPMYQSGPPIHPIQQNDLHAPQADDPPLPPIDALGEEDMSELNAAINDLDSEPKAPEAPEVPEVPITPTGKFNSYIKPSVEPQPEKPSDSDGEWVEKPLTTREVEEADVIGRKIDRMFSGTSKEQEGERHNYFAGFGNSGPNDFVTSESESIDENSITKDVPDSSVTADGAIMSDKEFAAFIESFEVPEPSREFKPLTRSSKPAAEHERESARSAAQH